MKQHKSLFFRALFCLLLPVTCFLKPASLHAQNTGLTGLWTGALSSDSNSIRKDQSFEIALTEYKGKVYGYSRSEFIVNDTLYYILKRVKGEITGDTCEVKDDEIISYNFRGKLDKGVKVISTFYRNKVDSTWYLAGKWKTSQTKKFYSVTGKVDLEEEKDLWASKIFPHLEELKLAEDVAFYKEQKQGPVIVKIAKPERFKSEYTDLVIKNDPVQVVSVSARPAVKDVAIAEPTISTSTPVNNTKPIINNTEVASIKPETTKSEPVKTVTNPIQPVTIKSEIAKTETAPVNTVTSKPEPVKTNTNPVQPVTIKSETAKAEPTPVNTASTKSEPLKINTNPVQPVTIKSEIAKAELTPVNTVTTKSEPVKANPVQPALIKTEIAKTESAPVKPVTTKSEPVKTNTNPVTTSTQVNINKPVTTKSEIAKTESAPVNPVTTKSESPIKETNPVNPVNPTNPDLAVVLPKRPEAALAIDKRKSEVSQIVYYRADSLELVLYDNGEIDGDTVSVLMNNEFIFTKQGLKASAAKKMIYLPAGRDEDFTITLYAENLGKYPPNTGLLVIHDGEDTYNLRFSADYDKNARILFKRKKE